MAGPAELRLWTALAAGAITGAACLWAYGKLTGQQELRRRRNRIQARVMELRLYRDEPGVILRAMGAILGGNVRLLATVIKPLAVLAIPLALVTIHLDALLGFEALPLDAPALVTVRVADPRQPIQLIAPPSIRVEAEVAAAAGHERVWRIQPTAPVDASLYIETGGAVLEKSVVARDRFTYLAPCRDRSFWGFITSPFEARLPAGNVARIEIGYSSAALSWLGIEWNWLVWFLFASLPAAVAAKVLLHIQL
ncbi:MAG: hypothetical protein IT160_18025 [Bryobacterales bacterium]|nr:hypothetical protein [Bryobacterales bacterium]